MSFLKSKRAALDPRASKIEPTARRRARGLLREEVARIAGISLTWYTWLEQGRSINPSQAVLESIAGALRLTKSERRHLFTLARPDLSARVASTLSTRLGAPLSALLEGLAPHAAYAVNGAWDVLAENAASRVVFGSFFQDARCEPNVLARLFLDPTWSRLWTAKAAMFASPSTRRPTRARALRSRDARGLVSSPERGRRTESAQIAVDIALG